MDDANGCSIIFKCRRCKGEYIFPKESWPGDRGFCVVCGMRRESKILPYRMFIQRRKQIANLLEEYFKAGGMPEIEAGRGVSERDIFVKRKKLRDVVNDDSFWVFMTYDRKWELKSPTVFVKGVGESSSPVSLLQGFDWITKYIVQTACYGSGQAYRKWSFKVDPELL